MRRGRALPGRVPYALAPERDRVVPRHNRRRARIHSSARRARRGGSLPPPFGLGRKERRPASLHAWLVRAVAEDPALGDEQLRRAARHAAMGSWEHARDLLAATGKDWPLRGHRISVLTQSAFGLRWPTAWLLAEPESLEARVLGAHVDVLELRALILRRDPSATDELARAVVGG